MFFVNTFAFNAGTSLINELTNLGLLTNLKCCLDAGDPNSYPGSGQTWSDLSGNGSHFYRGSGSGGDGADPTYVGNGSGGTYREYFSYDGGDYFTLAQTNPAWVNSFHKDNAVFTIAEWAYANNIDSTAKNYGGIGTAGPTSSGITFGNTSTAGSGLNMGFSVFNGAAFVADYATTHAATNNSWNFIAMALTESTGAGVFQVNGNQETITGKTYSSPDTGASLTLQVGAVGAGSVPDTSGNRAAALAMWDRALSAAELLSLYNATKSRFGL